MKHNPVRGGLGLRVPEKKRSKKLFVQVGRRPTRNFDDLNKYNDAPVKSYFVDPSTL